MKHIRKNYMQMNTGKCRVLARVLYTFVITFVISSTTVYADTANDFREWAEKERVPESSEYEIIYKEVEEEELVEEEESPEETKEKDLTTQIGQTKTKIIDNTINGARGDVILDLLESYTNLNYNLSSLMNTMQLEGIKTADDNFQEDYVAYDSATDFSSDWFDIGKVGNDTPRFAKGLEIVKLYGYEAQRNEDGEVEVTSEFNRWLVFTASEIYAPFNSYVYNVTNTTVIIKSGKNIAITIEGIDASNINNSQYFTQGEKIGDALEKSRICVKLDDDYINPLILFGYNGQKLYEDFIMRCTYLNVVPKGELYYKSK